MHNILNDFTGFLAYKFVDFMTANYPNYIESHPRFTVSNVQGEFTELSVVLRLFFLVLLIFVIAKLIGKFNYYKNKAYQFGVSITEIRKEKEKYRIKPTKIFTKKSAIIFSVLFIGIFVAPVLTFIDGYRARNMENGFRLEELSYSPGNQPITDEIVEAMNENVIPEIIKTGEMIEDVVTDPALGVEMIEEVTGVDVDKIQQKLE